MHDATVFCSSTGTFTLVHDLECFPNTPLHRVQVGAFMDATTFVHFYGSSPAKMEALILAGQAGPCRATYAETRA